jgi:DNA replication licensing factor MCM6
LFGAFSCLECGKEVENVAQQFRFTQPNMCRTPNCNNRDKWSLVRERCQFVDWQRVRIQENADEVPAGCLPRSMDAILRHETVETARAGDQVRLARLQPQPDRTFLWQVVLTGQLTVVPDGAALMMTGDRSSISKAAGGRRGDGAAEGNTGLKVSEPECHCWHPCSRVYASLRGRLNAPMTPYTSRTGSLDVGRGRLDTPAHA